MTRLQHRNWALPAGMLAILVGGAVLLGWALDIAALKSVLPGWVSMKPNTAVAFVLSGIGVLLTRPRSMSNASESQTVLQLLDPWSYAGRFCALFAGLIGLLSLGEYAFGWNPGFDQWLFPEPAGTVATSHPGRMAPDTALCFVLFAVGWDFARRPRQTKWTLIAGLSLGGMMTAVALVEILSYFTSALRTYGWDGMTMMALPTAVVLVVLGAALLLTVCTEYRLAAPSPARTASEFRTSLMFLLIFAVLSVGIVTIGIYYYRYTARQFLLKAEIELMAIADLKTGELVQFRKERLADANVLCNNPAFTQVVRRFLATPTDTDAQQQLHAWLDNYQRQYQYDIVRFLDVQGVTRLSVPGGLVPASAAFAPGVSEALRSGEVVFQDFYRSEHDQRICLALLVPILDDTDGKRPLGVIVLRIDPTNYLFPFIRRWPVPSDTAETLLVRREGNEVVFLNELRFQSNTALNLRFSLANTDLPAAMAALGQEGIVQGIDYRGVPVLAALGNIPDSPWHMVTRLDMAEVYGPLNERVWQLIAMVGLLVLGSAFGVGMVWNRQRVRFFRERVGAIEVLRESEERFGKVLESLTVLGVILDSTGRIVLCNHFLLALTGWSNEEVLGADWFERFIPQDAREYVKGDIFQKSLAASEVPAHYENEILTRQGERRLVSWNNSFVRDSAGQITGMASIGVDITERKRMEQSLQASEEKYRTLITQAADAIVLVGSDDQLLEGNRSAIEMFGYSGEEFCALPVAALLVPDDVPRHAEAFRRVVAGEHVLAERHFRRKDGSDFVGEVSACQISNKVVVGTIRDLTERKRAELHLKRLMAAIEQVAEIIVITDPAGIIEYANPVFEEVTGYSLSEVIGQNPKVLKSGVQDATFYRGMWETISGGGTFHGRVVNRRKDGRTYTADITISPVREASGRIVNFVAVQRDVSRELALELERSQAQKLESVGRLAAGIAHEINTPTQYVGDNIEFLQIAYDSLLPLARSVSELLEAGRSAPLPAELLSRTQDLLENTNLDYLVEQVPRALEQSMEGLGRITVIVQAMKEFSHPGSVEKTAVDLNHCIRSTSSVSHNEWKYVADLELDLEDGLPNVLCLPGELNQAILNMIVNAAHAIGDVVGEEAERKGKITIRTRQDGAWVEIRVADTGTGIPEAIRSKIFDPFFTTKEVGRGTGQGLVIARSVIVDKHRGTLAVESEVGKGTTFIIRLPIDDLGRADVARA